MGMVTGELSLGREYIRGLVAVSAICSLGVVVPMVMSGPHVGVLAIILREVPQFDVQYRWQTTR